MWWWGREATAGGPGTLLCVDQWGRAGSHDWLARIGLDRMRAQEHAQAQQGGTGTGRRRGRVAGGAESPAGISSSKAPPAGGGGE
jgi:hypothetical protein